MRQGVLWQLSKYRERYRLLHASCRNCLTFVFSRIETAMDISEFEVIKNLIHFPSRCYAVSTADASWFASKPNEGFTTESWVLRKSNPFPLFPSPWPKTVQWPAIGPVWLIARCLPPLVALRSSLRTHPRASEREGYPLIPTEYLISWVVEFEASRRTRPRKGPEDAND